LSKYDTVQIRFDGIAEQKDGSSVHLKNDSVHLEGIFREFMKVSVSKKNYIIAQGITIIYKNITGNL